MSLKRRVQTTGIVATLWCILGVVGLPGLVGLGTLEAQEPPYVMWIEPDVDTCVGDEVVTYRIFLEIKPGATPVVGWSFGVCHSPNDFKFVDAVAGSATIGVCNGNDASFVEIKP